MRTGAKFGLVAAGYVAAFVLAAGSVWIYATWADSPDRQASSGMYAFADSLLFLALFGLASVPPTIAGLIFLRPYPTFWRVLAIVALVMAAMGLASLGVCLASRAAGASPGLVAWSAFAVLRILLAPLVTLAFLLSGAFAPRRPARLALCGAAVIEVLVFGFWLILYPR